MVVLAVEDEEGEMEIGALRDWPMIVEGLEATAEWGVVTGGDAPATWDDGRALERLGGCDIVIPISDQELG